MNTKTMLGGLLALTVTVAACGNNGAEDTSQAATADTGAAAAAAPAPQAAGSSAGALLGTTGLGDAIVGTDGRSLYGFTNDVEAASTCYGTCADAWPPVIVGEGWTVGPGLDTGIFATTVRDDGQLQLVAGKWPLYYYTGDAVPGDVNGQGSGDVWFLVDPTGLLITEGDAASAAPAEAPAEAPAAAQAASIGTGSTSVGQVLTDEQGLTLYGFTNDENGVPACYDDCADAWPPVIVDAVPEGLDPEVFSVVERNDGQLQLMAGVWPLYRFAGDGAPGDVNGQGSGDVWFAAAPDGSLVKGDGGEAGAAPAEQTSETTPGY